MHDAEYSCVLFLPTENEDIIIFFFFTDELISSKKLQGWEMQWHHEFHILTSCRKILNLLKSSCSVKISNFCVHQSTIQFALCTFLCVPCISQMSVLSQKNGFKYWLGLCVRSGQCPAGLKTSIDQRRNPSQNGALLFLVYKWEREAPELCDFLGIVLDVCGRAAL